MIIQPFSTRRAQRGIGALLVVLLLLFGMTLVLFFANRGLIFEQRTSANQARATAAYEAAEAGIEWALANMNNPLRTVSAGSLDCLVAATSTASSFRDHVVNTNVGTLVLTPTGRRVACVRTSAGLSCDCPSAGAPAPTGEGPAFVLQFNDGPALPAGGAQPRLIEVVATGCNTAGSQCVSGAANAADATATVRVLAGMVPTIFAVPASPLVACQNLNLGGATGMHVTNVDAEAGGVTINAGGDYLTNPSSNISLATVPGSPPVGSIYKSDTSLSSLCPSTTGDPSSMFRAYFGVSKDEYRQSAETLEISCTTASDCESQLTTAINRGVQFFWIASNLSLTGNTTFGTTSRPVAIVVGGTTGTNGTADLGGGIDINGLVYATTQNWTDATGNTSVRGAMISEGTYTASGSLTVQYDRDLLDNLASSRGPMARVPGSWRDSASHL